MADVCELELYGDSPVESPTVADGAKAVAKRLRGIAKKGYLKEKRERTRVDRRKFNRLTTVLKEWKVKTGTPAVALALYKDKDGHLHVKYMGDGSFAGFASHPTVIQEFTKAALASMQSKEKPNEGQVASVIDRWTLKAVLEDDLLEKPIDIKRSLICKLVLGNDLMKRKNWKNCNRPFWWPTELSFRSPNQSPRFCVAILDTILVAAHKYFKNLDLGVGEPYPLEGSTEIEGDEERE